MGTAGRRAVGFYLEIRVIPVLLWSVTAITLGTALAWHGGADVWVRGYVGALAVGVLLQGVVAHALNEIADWRSGTDRDPAPRVISGGSRTLTSGLLRERDLLTMGGLGALAATGIGLGLAASRGWWLVAFGAVGLAGAVLYSLPPVRLAYRPYAGETVAAACVWSCAAGAFSLQAGHVSATAAWVAAAHAAGCVAMLMIHHYLDSGPDARARPPKVTSVVRLGAQAKAYAAAWAAAALVVACGLVALAGADFAPLAVGLALALAAHLVVRPDDPAGVTRAEMLIIVSGIAGGLATAALLATQTAPALAAAAVLVPVELAVARYAPASAPST